MAQAKAQDLQPCLAGRRSGIGRLRSPVSSLLSHPKPFLLIASISLRAADLPYFALSWIMTLMSHDVTSLQIIVRLFDVFFAHNPALIIYFGVAVSMGPSSASPRHLSFCLA
jgi:Rab-GTPase-TBC domain